MPRKTYGTATILRSMPVCGIPSCLLHTTCIVYTERKDASLAKPCACPDMCLHCGGVMQDATRLHIILEASFTHGSLTTATMNEALRYTRLMSDAWGALGEQAPNPVMLCSIVGCRRYGVMRRSPAKHHRNSVLKLFAYAPSINSDRSCGPGAAM